MRKHELIVAIRAEMDKRAELFKKENPYEKPPTITNRQIDAVIEAFVSVIIDSLDQNKKPTFPGVGHFYLKEIKEKKVGATFDSVERTVVVPAHKEPDIKFLPSFKKMFS